MSWRRKLGLSPESMAARQVAAEARDRLVETQGQWPQVIHVTQRLAALREKNHFAEAIRAAVIGGEEGEQGTPGG